MLSDLSLGEQTKQLPHWKMQEGLGGSDGFRRQGKEADMRIREEWNHMSSRLGVRCDEGGVDMYNEGS